MSCRRATVVRWPRRDHYPVLVGALTVVFPVGIFLWVIDAAGELTVFGIHLIPELDPWLVAGIALSALGVALVSTTLATLGVIAATPAQLFRGDRPSDAHGGTLDG